MKLGGVFIFESDQASGYAARRKLHIFLGQTDHYLAPAPYVFLFISSANYGGCFPIKAADYNFLSHDSYISSGKLVYYSRAYLDSVAVVKVGEMTIGHLKDLRHHLVDSEFMEGYEIKIACGALQAVL